MNKKTPEEKIHFEQNVEIQKFVESPGWTLVKEKMMEKINDLQSIMNIEFGDPVDMAHDIKVRRNTADILVEWVREIEGQVLQFKNNDLGIDETDDDFIIRE